MYLKPQTRLESFHITEVVAGETSSIKFERVSPQEEQVVILEHRSGLSDGGVIPAESITGLQFPNLKASQARKAKQLLCKYSHVFATSDADLGCTTMH